MEIKTQGLGVFQYCDAQGKIVDEFPVNPNGSIFNIAAVSNKSRQCPGHDAASGTHWEW